jgi:hypothetical protein
MPDGPAAPLISGNRQFPCQQCGAKVDFAPGTALLRCPYCGFETQIPQSECQIEELDFQEYLKKLAEKQEVQVENRVQCQQCAAETTMPPEAAAGSCPFCGASLVIAAHTSSLIKPKSLLPFKITQKEGVAIFRRWIQGLWFAPNDLKSYAQSEGKLAGIYEPFWTFDASATSVYRGERGENYSETETFSAFENGKSVTKTRKVNKIRWKSVGGTVWNQFDDVLVMASRSLPRKYADRLEPWDLPNLVPYADDYLSGFRAESYQVDLPSGFETARGVMDERIRASIRRDIGGDHQRIHSVQTSYDNITFKHILLPVWMSAYRYRQKIYRILVNARTGELQGEHPYSAWKIAAAIAIGVIVAALLIVIGVANG